MFKKVLIANRGEIAMRVIRTCKEMGIKTVAVYSTADKDSLHVRFADEAVCIGPAPSNESYLKIANIIAAAEITNADAIHPGYGFLSENAKFSKICSEHKIKFIGPSPEMIEKMGDKATAVSTMISAKVPTIPGSGGAIETEEEGLQISSKIGFPVMIKASAGGFTTIGWAPDGEVRGSYAVTVTNTDFNATGLSDVDGDSSVATYTCTKSTNPNSPTTNPDIY